MIAEYHPVSSTSEAKASCPAQDQDVEKQSPHRDDRDEPQLCTFVATYAHWLVSSRRSLNNVGLFTAFGHVGCHVAIKGLHDGPS